MRPPVLSKYIQQLIMPRPLLKPYNIVQIKTNPPFRCLQLKTRNLQNVISIIKIEKDMNIYIFKCMQQQTSTM